MMRKEVNLNDRKRPMGRFNQFLVFETHWSVPLYLEGSG